MTSKQFLRNVREIHEGYVEHECYLCPFAKYEYEPDKFVCAFHEMPQDTIQKITQNWQKVKHPGPLFYLKRLVQVVPDPRTI
ncbi:MAG: hypothetical protein IJ815_08755 [Lachnospiraceae bacterium]|nr:hypothetical protein [Lachnospiraceae bacterium]